MGLSLNETFSQPEYNISIKLFNNERVRNILNKNSCVFWTFSRAILHGKCWSKMSSPKFEVPSAPIKCVRISSHLDVYVYYECSVATIKLLGCTHALRGQG